MTILRERVSRHNPSAYLTYATGWSIRLWREEPLDSHRHFEPGRTSPDPDIGQTFQRFVSYPVSPLELAKALLELPRVNAVEIVDMTGAGEVLYRDWP